MLFSTAQNASHGDEKPVRSMLYSWLFGIMLPASAIAWKVSAGSLLCSISAALAIPILAIAQGSLGILRYRLHFGDAPLPLSPSHGVVIVNPTEASNTPISRTTDHTTTTPSKELPVRLQKAQSFPLSLGCQCGLNHSQQPISCGAFTTTMFGRTSSLDDTTMLGESSRSLNAGYMDHGDTRPPIRLLVIGDSLAIGVGQARQCTPVMPEVIAKTLSARLQGRVVYWTCHGAPGASTGWIVRELERGVTYLQKDCHDKTELPDDEEDEHVEISNQPTCNGRSASSAIEIQSKCSDTDDSSSDESASPTGPYPAAAKQQQAIWRERLAQHRKRFDPEALGPYDVVVVMTGSNDLKSAFFPFLLTGEDAEFRRQAKARGGNYTKELRRLLETLNRGMRSQLQNIRYSVGAATETVIEKVEETMERIVSSSSPVARKMSPLGSSFREKLDARKEIASPRNNEQTESSETGSMTTTESMERFAALQKQFPLVVLPGLFARALPIFRIAPLRWLAVPIVDILDMHKRKLAKSHPGEVLFVPPPSIDELVQYESCTGDIWRQRCQEDTVLTLRDIRRLDCLRIESDLREYYSRKDKRIWTGEGLRKKPSHGWFSSLFSRAPAPGASIFSVDQIHPTDDGYDFWGRYIANAIADEWRVHPNRQPPE
jgi:lysophospholipase L1-like esterase